MQRIRRNFVKAQEIQAQNKLELRQIGIGRRSEKNDLKKTHANSYTLGVFSVGINYIVIN